MAFPNNGKQSQRDAWNRALNAKAAKVSSKSVRNMKGMGPNKACGHKGGICRQGSKRGVIQVGRIGSFAQPARGFRSEGVVLHSDQAGCRVFGSIAFYCPEINSQRQTSILQRIENRPQAMRAA